MFKKIILHIGLEKSASTSIQRAFYDNRLLLQEKGLIYPDLGVYNHQFLTWLYADESRKGDVIKPEFGLPSSAEPKDFLNFFSQSIESDQNTTLLLSDERLSSRLSRATLVDDLVNDLYKIGLEVHVVCVVRDWKRYLVSLYQEYIKSGGYRNFVDWLINFDYIELDWRELLKPWRNRSTSLTEFQLEHDGPLSVFQFVQQHSDLDPVGMKALLSTFALKRNKGLSANAVHALRLANFLLGNSSGVDIGLGKRIARYVLSRSPGKKFGAGL